MFAKSFPQNVRHGWRNSTDTFMLYAALHFYWQNYGQSKHKQAGILVERGQNFKYKNIQKVYKSYTITKLQCSLVSINRRRSKSIA